MPLISVIPECYNELEEIKKELVEQKKANGRPTKTTFGEVVCMLIRERRAEADRLTKNSKNESDSDEN